MDDVEGMADNWVSTGIRTFSIIDSEVGKMRRRMLLTAFQSNDPVQKRNGAFWSMHTDIASFELADSLKYDAGRARELAEEPTRLKDMSATTKRRLINYGFALSDAGLRRYVVPGAPAPTGYPYPNVGV